MRIILYGIVLSIICIVMEAGLQVDNRLIYAAIFSVLGFIFGSIEGERND